MTPGGAKRGGKASLRARCSVEEVLDALPASDLAEAWRHWSPEVGAGVPPEATAGPSSLPGLPTALMLERLGSLGKRLALLMDILLEAPRWLLFSDLATHGTLERMSTYDLEAALAPGTARADPRRGVVTWPRPASGPSPSPRTSGIRSCGSAGACARGCSMPSPSRAHRPAVRRPGPRAPHAAEPRARDVQDVPREEAAVARIERLPEGLRGSWSR